jgi:hypothetical protein
MNGYCRFDEAETELLNLVSHEDATPDLCTAAIRAALDLPESFQSVRAVLPMVLERFPGALLPPLRASNLRLHGTRRHCELALHAALQWQECLTP